MGAGREPGADVAGMHEHRFGDLDAVAVVYAEHEALIRIDNGDVIRGRLPRTAGNLVEEWRRLHVDDLVANWQRAQEPGALSSIEPLQ